MKKMTIAEQVQHRRTGKLLLKVRRLLAGTLIHCNDQPSESATQGDVHLLKWIVQLSEKSTSGLPV